MCGIAGFADFNKKTEEPVLRSMTSVISHRGPDGDGHLFDQAENGFVGMGHRRLSIIDLSNAAAQPMYYKQLVLIFNGEIYNYAEIREELQGKGHSFITHSDTEVILHAYEEWGQDCLSRFIGMYTFVVYDKEKNCLFCVRDRAGVKPFFWYFADGLFLFGSELCFFLL